MANSLRLSLHKVLRHHTAVRRDTHIVHAVGQTADVDKVGVLYPIIERAVFGIKHLHQFVILEFQDAIAPGTDIGDGGVVGIGRGTDEIRELVEILARPRLVSPIQ